MTQLPEWHDGWLLYLSAQVTSENSRKNYARRVRAWLAAGATDPALWIASAVRTLPDGRQAGLAERDMRRNAFRHFDGYCRRKGGEFRHTWLGEGWELPEWRTIAPGAALYLDDVQRDHLLRRLLRGEPREAALAALMFAAAGRRAELRRLRMQDVRLDGEIPHLVLYGKGNKERYVPLPNESSEHLRLYLTQYRPHMNIHDSELVFLSQHGGPYHNKFMPLIREVRRALAAMVKAGQLGEHALAVMEQDSFRPLHLFRHLRATQMLESGKTDVRTVQKILGHSSLSTTQRYLDKSLKRMHSEIMDIPALPADESSDESPDESSALIDFRRRVVGRRH